MSSPILKSIAVGSLDKLLGVIDALIKAIRAGELDDFRSILI
jgi:hypothetical protein